MLGREDMSIAPGAAGRPVFFHAAGSALVAALLVVITLSARRHGFGVSDIPFVMFWTMPLALAAAAAAVALKSRSICRTTVGTCVTGVALGSSLGLVWTVLIRALLGPLFGAISFPAILVWSVGGVCGVVGGLVLTGAAFRTRLSRGLLMAGLAIAVTLLYGPAARQALGAQALSLILVRWSPDSGELSINTDRLAQLDDETQRLLASATEHGRLEVWGRSVHGRGVPAMAVIVLNARLASPVRLPQPDRTTVIYVQDGSEFRLFPRNANLLEREIEIGDGDGRVWYSVEFANGAQQGGSGFEW